MEFELPDLGGIVGGGFLLILAAAGALLAPLLALTLGRAPVIGGWVNREIVPWLRDASDSVIKRYAPNWRFLAGLWNWAQDITTKPLIYAYNFAASVVQTIRYICGQVIPDAENRALNYALGLTQTLRIGFDQEIAQYRADLQGDYATLNARITAVENAAFGRAATGEAQAVKYATGLVHGTVTDLDNYADEAIRIAWPDADGDIAALRKVIGSDFPGINDLLGALGGLGTAGLVGLMIRAIAGTATVTELAEQCTIPNCRNLSQLGRDLAELASDASEAALIGWLIFCVTDPVAAAADIQTVALNPLRDVAYAASRLFGGPSL